MYSKIEKQRLYSARVVFVKPPDLFYYLLKEKLY